MVFILTFKNENMTDTYYLENNDFSGDFYELAFELASKEEGQDPIVAGINVIETLINDFGFVEIKANIINFDENFF